ncbi:MAG: 3'-5' exonuclease, partial [Bacteroidota bacterium]|nr:3'-5' exonuclease [Bacteroidota bacterium]
KTVFSRNESGEKLQVIQSLTDTEEGFNISSDIFDKRYSMQLNWSDFAILYRTNAQSRIFEETLRKKNIPYKIYGGLSFYERKEIKDILAYFRMVINPEDEEALKRIINYPKRGIGDTTVRKILELAEDLKITPWHIITGISGFTDYFNSGTVKKITIFSELILSFRNNNTETDAYSKAREIALGSGIMKELRESESPEEVSRFENMEELLNGIKIFTEAAETNGEPSNLEAYLANVALLTDQDNEKEEDRDKVTLMTMHSAKGLEFKNVYIAGLEDTLFPSPMSAGNPKELEEERRLFYVAVTRAEKMATLSYALNRYRWGNLERSNPSRFLREIDPVFLDYPQTGGKPFRTQPRREIRPKEFRDEPGEYFTPGRYKKFVKPETNSVISAEGNGSDEFSEGESVQHERFGKGVILSIEGYPPNTTATVEFENDGRKKLLLRFARLKKI